MYQGKYGAFLLSLLLLVHLDDINFTHRFPYRVGPDVAIISTSTNHEDTTSIVATLSRNWQPCDALNEETQEVNAVISNWIPLNDMSCSTFKTNYTVETPSSDDPVLIKMNGLSERDITDLCCRDDVLGSEQTVIRLNVHKGAKANQTVRRFNLLCVAPFLKQATNLKYDLKIDASWTPIKPAKNDVSFGCCKVTIPRRPEEAWWFNKERGTWERLSKPGESREYFLALQKARKLETFFAISLFA